MLDKQNIIPSSCIHDIKDIKDIKIRTAKASAQTKTTKTSTRDLGDLMRAVNNYMFITCNCGLKMKLPPNIKKSKINCPRCGKENLVPIAELAAIQCINMGTEKCDVKPKNKTTKNDSFVYNRKSKGWESFSCQCGSPKQLSPAFNKPYFVCNICGKKIVVK